MQEAKHRGAHAARDWHSFDTHLPFRLVANLHSVHGGVQSPFDLYVIAGDARECDGEWWRGAGRQLK